MVAFAPPLAGPAFTPADDVIGSSALTLQQLQALAALSQVQPGATADPAAGPFVAQPFAPENAGEKLVTEQLYSDLIDTSDLPADWTPPEQTTTPTPTPQPSTPPPPPPNKIPWVPITVGLAVFALLNTR